MRVTHGDSDVCGEPEFNIILTLDEAFCQHEETTTVPANEATCTIDGYSEGEQCNNCGEWASGHTLVEMAQHIDEDNDNICDVCDEAASDLIIGQVKYVSYNPNSKTIIKFIPEHTGGYDFVIHDMNEAYDCKDYWLKDANGNTLFSGGLYNSDDGNYLKEVELIAGEAYYFSIISDDDIGSASVLIRSFCPHESTESFERQEPTCESSGREAYVYCNDCSKTISGGEWIDSLGHNYSDWIVDEDFTCTTDGSMSRVCSNCQDEQTQILHAMHIDENADALCDECSEAIEVLYEGTDGTAWWKLYNDGELVIGGTGCAGSDYYDDDEDYGNRDYAFYAYRDYIKSVRVMNSVTKLGYDFSACHQLKKVTLADTVKEIEFWVFADCTSLETVVLGEGLEELRSTFQGCSALKSIVLPASCSYMNAAFSNCRSLESATILNRDYDDYNLDSTFYNCNSLKTINYVGSENDEYEISNFAKENPDITINYNYVLEHTHSFETVYFVDGNCFEYGLAYYKCDCGTTYKESVYPHHEDEEKDRICDICGESTLIRSGDCSGEDSEVTWSIYDDGDLVISGDGVAVKPYNEDEGYDDENPSVPPYYDGRVKNLIIEEGVTGIDDEMFLDFTNIESISFPDGIEYIGWRTFENCTGLTEISLPDSVTSLSTYAFKNCKNLSSLELSDNIEILDEGVFENCVLLTEITLPENLADIYTNAAHPFDGCINLESFQISDENEYFKTVDGVLYNKDVTEVISCPFGKTEIDLPDTVNELRYFCFRNTNLETADLPDTLNKITWGAFYGSAIKNIEIPESVSTIERWAFNDCDELKVIDIPGSVKTIDAHAFSGCSSAETISIGDGVRSIYGCVFQGCSSVKKVVIPDSVVALGGTTDSYGFDVFSFCTSLEEVVLSKNIKSIPPMCFVGCTNLKKLVVPVGSVLTYVSENASITGVTEVIDGITYLDNTVIYSECEYTDEEVVIRDGTISIVSDISNAVIDTKGNVKDINIPLSVEYINGGVLGSKWLEAQDDGMINLGSVAYKYKGTMPENTQYTISNNIKSISSGAFYGQENLASLEISEGVKIIGASAFAECSGLRQIQLPDTLTDIGRGAFSETAIESIVIPSSVETVSDSAFYGCSELKEVVISDGVKMLGDYGMDHYVQSGVFGNCSSLESIILPKSVELIWVDCFYACSELESITIYNSDCEIYDSENTIPENTVIYGLKDSTAQAYAEKYDRTFVELETPITGAENTRIDYDNSIVYTSVKNCGEIEEILDLSENTTVEITASLTYEDFEIYGTGTIVTVYDGDNHIGDFTLIVDGDLNGDATCDVIDAAAAHLYSAGLDEPTQNEIYAANGCVSDELDAASYQNVVNMCLAS